MNSISKSCTERLLTVGDPKKVITSFALPILLSQLLQQLYNTADAWIVGQYLGKDALAAVGSSGSLIFLLISFFTGTSMGAGVVISKFFGAGDSENVSRAVHTDIFLSFLCGIVITVTGVLLTPQILVWMRTDENVIEQSTLYLSYYFCGALAMVLYNDLKSIMNAVGDSRRPLYYLAVSAGLNIFLDWLFIAVLRGDIRWAAIATTISQFVSASLCLLQLRKKGTVYRLSFRKLRLHGDILRQIVRCGVPTGVQNSVIGFANVLVQSNINTFTDDAMAACGAYFKIEGFAFLPITSYSLALTTFIGQNLGAHEYDRAKQGARFGILTSVTLAEVIGVLTYFGAPLLISFFNSDPEVVRIGTQQCHIEALFYCFLAFSHCIAGVCRGAGKATVPMIVMLSVWCIFRILYITAAMEICHDIRLLFCAYPLTWGISSAIFLAYYLKSDWVHAFDRAEQRKITDAT